MSREINLQASAYSATSTITVEGDGSLVIHVTASSSGVWTFTGGVQKTTTSTTPTKTTVAVKNLKNGLTYSTGASISVSAGDILVINTHGLGEIKATLDSGSSTFYARRWDWPIYIEPSVQCYSFIADGSDELLISAAARRVYGVHVFSLDATPVYVKLYDKATTPASTDTPIYVHGLLANSTAANGATSNAAFPAPIALTNGLGVRGTTGIANNNTGTLSASEVVINIFYS